MEIVLKKENFGKWFPGVRKNLTTLAQRGGGVGLVHTRLISAGRQSAPEAGS